MKKKDDYQWRYLKEVSGEEFRTQINWFGWNCHEVNLIATAMIYHKPLKLKKSVMRLFKCEDLDSNDPLYIPEHWVVGEKEKGEKKTFNVVDFQRIIEDREPTYPIYNAVNALVEARIKEALEDR